MTAPITLMLFIAGGCALVYGLYGGIRAIQKHPTITFFDIALVFMVGLLPLVAVFYENQENTQFNTTEYISALLGGGMVIWGIILAMLELRRPSRLKQSRGLLSMGVGVLLVMMTLITFMTAQVQVQTSPAISATDTPAPSILPTITPIATSQTIRNSPTPRPTLPTNTPTTTRTQPASLLIITPTRLNTQAPLSTFLITPSHTPTPNTPTIIRPPTGASTPEIPCLVIMNFNVNLREMPSSDGRILITIPFETTLFGIARTADSSWWQVDYENRRGWVSDDVVTVTSTCRQLTPTEG